MSDSLWPHGLQYARLPCSSPSPRACYRVTYMLFCSSLQSWGHDEPVRLIFIYPSSQLPLLPPSLTAAPKRSYIFLSIPLSCRTGSFYLPTSFPALDFSLCVYRVSHSYCICAVLIPICTYSSVIVYSFFPPRVLIFYMILFSIRFSLIYKSPCMFYILICYWFHIELCLKCSAHFHPFFL